jgi:DNA-binding LacI/PurR family transcriptional regulator
MATTLRDLAQHLQLSVTTVSDALKEHPVGYVAPQTRERVRAAARQFGYQPNVHARRLVKCRAEGVVGIFSATLPPVGPGMLKIRALQDHLIAYGYEVPLMVGSLRAPHRSAELMAALCRERPAALVWLFAREVEADLAEQAQRYVREGGILVTMDHSTDLPGDQVVFDRAGNTYLAVHHLLSLGHRQIGLFLGADNWPESPRADGVRRACREWDVDPGRLHLFELPGMSDYANGERLAGEFLRRNPRPTAMTILNDQTAAAFMARVMAAGVRIPEELSVVGHDNQPWGAYLAVPLTTVTHPLELLAEAAARMLHERLSGQETGQPRRLVITSDLVRRASTAPPGDPARGQRATTGYNHPLTPDPQR